MKDLAVADPTQSIVTNADAIADFVVAMRERGLPDDVLESARFCIVDWFGVALGASDQVPVQALARVVAGWRTQGRALLLTGGTAAPPAAALLNGTMAHCLDFDDTHVGSISHLSGPVLAAAFALGTDLATSPPRVLRAFVTGFEVGARLGLGGFGVATNERHTHATGVFGCLGAAAAASSLGELDHGRIVRAMGLAATQVGGLTASFGTPAKPFHAGKAAFNGVLAAQMAHERYEAATDLVEPGGGLGRALVQDGKVGIAEVDFSAGWEINRNTFKPYASCLLTHPVIDSCKLLRAQLQADGGRVVRLRIRVNPLAIQLAGKARPATPFEGKFSLAFCCALALGGYRATQLDFSDATLNDGALRELVACCELIADPSLDVRAATVDAELDDGRTRSVHTPLALGNPERPMSWGDMEQKFLSLTAPRLGDVRARGLFERLRAFEAMPSLDALASSLLPAAEEASA